MVENGSCFGLFSLLMMKMAKGACLPHILSPWRLFHIRLIFSHLACCPRSFKLLHKFCKLIIIAHMQTIFDKI